MRILQFTLFFVLIVNLTYGQDIGIKQLSPNSEISLIIKLIESQNKGTFTESKEITIDGVLAKVYGYKINEWDGIGECSYFSYYTYEDELVGCEFYFVPSLPKSEIFKIFPNNELIDSLLIVDENGIEVINYYYAEYDAGGYMVLSSYVSAKNDFVIVTFFNENWAKILESINHKEYMY